MARTGPRGGGDVREAVACGELRVRQDVGQLTAARVGDPARREPGFQLGAGQRGEDGVDFAFERGPVRDAGAAGGEPLVGDPVRAFDGVLAEGRPLPVVLHGQHELGAVAGGEGAVGRDRRMAGAGPRWRRPAVTGVVEREPHPFDERIEQADLERGPAPGAFPVVERGKDAGEGVHPGADVRGRDAALGRLARRPGHRDQAGFGLDEQVVGLGIAVGAARAVAGHRAGDQPRPGRADRGRAEPEPFGDTGREVLHEHVGAVEQRRHDRLRGVALEVEGDALLGAVEPDEVAGLAVHGLVVGAGEVAAARPLDLEHARPEVGQVPGGQRRGDGLFAGHDGDAVEGQVDHGGILPSPRSKKPSRPRPLPRSCPVYMW